MPLEQKKRDSDHIKDDTPQVLPRRLGRERTPCEWFKFDKVCSSIYCYNPVIGDIIQIIYLTVLMNRFDYFRLLMFYVFELCINIIFNSALVDYTDRFIHCFH